MSAIGFLSGEGGIATVGGAMEESKRRQLNKIILLLKKPLTELGKNCGLKYEQLEILHASALIIAEDREKYVFCFAAHPGKTLVRYEQYLDRIIDEEGWKQSIARHIGRHIFSCGIKKEHIYDHNKIKNFIGHTVNSYLDYLEQEMNAMSVDEKLCFVIMSFSDSGSLKDFYELAIKPTVEALGFKCERVDEQHFNGSIRDQIIGNITKSKFIIADMTEARPNCYYELGIAHALKKDVIHIVNDTNDIHFDVQDFNFLVYTRIPELKEKLELRIKGTLGLDNTDESV